MNNDKFQLKLISQKGFYDYWNSKKATTFEEEAIVLDYFKSYVETIPKLAFGEYYWQVFDNAYPFPKILMVGGAVEKLLPISSEDLIHIRYEDFFSFFHPDDIKPTFTFVSKVFEILFKLDKLQRQYFNCSIYTRIRNFEGKYVWNSIQYPALYFDEKNHFCYGMALYTQIHSFIKPDALPTLTILDSTNKSKQIYTCFTSEDEKGVQKDYPTLSKREREIISLLSQGKASKQMCDILGITKNTVDNHRQRLLKKFEVSSSAELVTKALIY